MKANDQSARDTPDLLTGLEPKPTKLGRPKKKGALTNAQRQAKYRQTRLPLVVGARMSGTVRQLAADFDMTPSEVLGHLVRYALCNKNWGQQGFPK